MSPALGCSPLWSIHLVVAVAWQGGAVSRGSLPPSLQDRRSCQVRIPAGPALQQVPPEASVTGGSKRRGPPAASLGYHAPLTRWGCSLGCTTHSWRGHWDLSPPSGFQRAPRLVPSLVINTVVCCPDRASAPGSEVPLAPSWATCQHPPGGRPCSRAHPRPCSAVSRCCFSGAHSRREAGAGPRAVGQARGGRRPEAREGPAGSGWGQTHASPPPPPPPSAGPHQPPLRSLLEGEGARARTHSAFTTHLLARSLGRSWLRA